MNNAKIIAACEKHLPVHASNCSGFVTAVARDFGIGLTGQANNIYKSLNAMSSPDVVRYGSGLDGTSRAARAAADGGLLVVGASYSPTGHGHVAIVVGLASDGRALVYGGQLGKPENASRNAPITSRAWARYKLAHPYVAAEPPSFYGIIVRPPYRT